MMLNNGGNMVCVKNGQSWLALSVSLLFVIQPEILLRQSLSCLRERSVSAVDKELYTWVSDSLIYGWD